MAATINHVSDHDQRLGDYLDDKLQTLADLESLDSLLLNVRNQQTLLKQQLQDARTDLAEAQKTSTDHAVALQARQKELDSEQQSVDRRLRELSGSNSAERARLRFQSSVGKLNKLQAARQYADLVRRVDQLSADTLKKLKTSDSAALDAYQDLYPLLQTARNLTEAADAATAPVLAHITAKITHVRSELGNAFVQQFRTLLKKIEWPKPDIVLSEGDRDTFAGQVRKLLRLQRPELEALEQEATTSSGFSPPMVLIPFAELTHPLELGFRFHFDGTRETNRIESPERFLSYVMDRILDKYLGFVESNFQPFLREQFYGTDLNLNAAYLEAKSAFITAVLPMLRNKLQSILPRISEHPALLSRLMRQLQDFDAQLRGGGWDYNAGSRSVPWPGLTGEILSADSVFAHWLGVEKDFALERYHKIVDAPDAFDLDFDSVGAGETKPSKAAIQVNYLLEEMTNTYRGLVSFSHRLRFLIDIQVSIFDLFHARLADALNVYNARTSALGRTSKEEQTALQGIGGLERLCRIFGSADYLVRAMRDWNYDEFFLVLWSELQQRASQKSSSQAALAGPLTVAQVAERTSETIAFSAASQQDADDGALFDETAASYLRLRGQTEKVMADLLANAIRSSLSTYTRANPWASLSSDATTNNALPTSVTANLTPVLSTLSSLLGYLSRALGSVPLRRLSWAVRSALDEVLINRVVFEHSFSGGGAAQFVVDMAAVEGVLGRVLGGAGGIETGLVRVRQAARLLAVPVIRSRKEVEAAEAREEEMTGEVGLHEASVKLFERDGDTAMGLLDDMGLGHLSVADARKVLARRIEQQRG